MATYGDVARLAGQPRAARAVGNVMRGCNRPDVPCHRVIAAGGRLGGYGGQEALKRALLVAEGCSAGGRVRDLSRVRWTDPSCNISIRGDPPRIQDPAILHSATGLPNRGTLFARWFGIIEPRVELSRFRR